MPVNCVVAEISSGRSSLAIPIARTARKVYAVDTAYRELKSITARAAQEDLANIVPICTDSEQLPLGAKSCDVVIMIGALDRVSKGMGAEKPWETQLRLLTSVFNALVPGGFAYVSVDNKLDIRRMFGRKGAHSGLPFTGLIWSRLAGTTSRVFGRNGDRRLTHSTRGLRRLLTQSGFAYTETVFPLPGHQVFRFMSAFESRRTARFVYSRMRSHPKFKHRHYLAANAMVSLGLHRQFAPSIGMVAYKPGAS
ncbi:MAG: class I SAM-dependent methyltransferase [Anaerolineales bacterium]